MIGIASREESIARKGTRATRETVASREIASREETTARGETKTTKKHRERKEEKKRKAGRHTRNLSYVPVRKEILCNTGEPGMAGNVHADDEAREAAVMKPGVGGVYVIMACLDEGLDESRIIDKFTEDVRPTHRCRYPRRSRPFFRCWLLVVDRLVHGCIYSPITECATKRPLEAPSRDAGAVMEFAEGLYDEKSGL